MKTSLLLPLIFLMRLSGGAQILFPILSGSSSAASSVFGTPVGSSGSASGAGVTTQSGTQTTTAGDLLFVYASIETACANIIASANGTGSGYSLPTDTGSDTFTPIIPANGAKLAGIRLTAAGSGYTGTPTCAISGGGGSSATCTATQSGGAVAGVTLTATGSGFTSAPTVTISGGGGSGGTAEITAYGQQSGTSGTQACGAAWYAKNIAGTSNNQVTANSGGSVVYHAISVAEVSGPNASTPLDAGTGNPAGAESSANATSITSSSFSTSSANTIVFCGSRVEFTNQTWTAGNIGATSGTLLTAAIPGGNGSTNDFQAIEYQKFTSTQSGITAAISSGANAVRNMICAAFKN